MILLTGGLMPPTDGNDLHLLSYRVQEMETKLDNIGKEIIGQVTVMVSKYDEVLREHITHKVIIGNQGSEILTLKERVIELQKDIVAVKLSMAERVAFGLGGGAGGAILIELVKMLIGT